MQKKSRQPNHVHMRKKRNKVIYKSRTEKRGKKEEEKKTAEKICKLRIIKTRSKHQRQKKITKEIRKEN